MIWAKHCIICGSPFKTRCHNRRHCSKVCRSQSYAQAVPPLPERFRLIHRRWPSQQPGDLHP